MSFLDFLFPKYCINCRKLGDYICPNCFSYISFNDFEICLICNKQTIDGLTHKKCQNKFAIDGTFSILGYKGVVKKIIYNFKYKPYVSDLKTIIIDLFYEGLIQKENFMRIYEEAKNDLILVSVPLHTSKLKSRGYNQSEILAKELSLKLNLRVKPVLERVKKTKSQFGLDKKDRRKNIVGAFKISRPEADQPLAENFKCKSVLLIDDILTTGSTLKEAAKILKQNGAKKVWGITLARD